MSKRHFEEFDEKEEEQGGAKRPRVCAPWAELCGDLLRALVCTEPSLLPALYLVCKAYKELLDSDPNGLYWKLYFNSVPGYSDYVPGVNFTDRPSFFHDWRTLVWVRKELRPRYYFKLQHPVWPCGRSVPDSPSQAILMFCRCGTKHSPRTPITAWLDETIKLDCLPVPDQPLKFSGYSNTHIGCTWRMAGPCWYVYNDVTETILHVEETSLLTKATRTVLAAARPEDIPADKQWQVARVVGLF